MVYHFLGLRVVLIRSVFLFFAIAKSAPLERLLFYLYLLM